MHKKIPFYPFLFIFCVILNPLVNNIEQIDPSQVIRPMAVMFIIVTVFLSTFRLILRNWHTASLMVFIGFFGFFTSGHLNNIMIDHFSRLKSEVTFLIIFTLLIGAAIFLSRRKILIRIGGPGKITPLFNGIISIILLSQFLLGLNKFSGAWIDNPTHTENKSVHSGQRMEDTLDCSISPDIYWIVLDGYGRKDVLKEIYGIDTAPFIDSLEAKGFYVADRSYTNYTQTVYSIPSAINFKFLSPKPPKANGFKYFPNLIEKNRLMQLLQQCDYEMVAFETGFVFTDYRNSDHYLSAGRELSEFEGVLLAGTPIDFMLDELDIGMPDSNYEAHRTRVRYSFDTLSEMPDWSSPKFVYAHIISPHPPFVFDPNGNPVQPNRSYSIGDGDDYRGTWEEYKQGYASQVQYINQLLDQTLTSIINRSSTPPVIIIQGDHGPGGHLEWDSADESCLLERSAILNAYYLPNDGSKLLYPGISPINSFRIVLKAYFGLDLELLSDETYFTSASLGEKFINITDRRDSTDNCN